MNSFDISLLKEGFYQTLYMTFFSSLGVLCLGTLIGYILFLTGPNKLFKNRMCHMLLNFIINIIRAIPFVILAILLTPLAKVLTGSILGTTAFLPALIIGATPFFARMVAANLKEVDHGVIEAIASLGAKPKYILYAYFKESFPAYIAAFTITLIAITGYTAMAGILGAGGLGDVAKVYGFNRNNPTITFVATLLLLMIVFTIQWMGDFITKKSDKR